MTEGSLRTTDGFGTETSGPRHAERSAAHGGEVSTHEHRTELKDQVRVHIRWMIRRDMAEVLQAEQQSFDYSWTEEDSCAACASATASAWSRSTTKKSSAS